jgi:NAD(P)-dependent dehydrogenase (short-subunit alcohol dehydrogenase family)
MTRLIVTGVPEPSGESIRRALGDRATLDTAVVGAGAQETKPFLEVSSADWESVVGGLREAFGAVREAARRGDRRIVLVSSVTALRPVSGASLPAIAGAFLHMLGQVAAVELGPSGATVNVVVPGFVDDERFTVDVPIGRATSPEDVAEVCAFLASEAAEGVSGAIVPVDGGFAVTKAERTSPLQSA